MSSLPSDSIPLFDGYRASLVNGLDAGDSHYVLSLQFPDMIRELKKLPIVASRSTEVFENDPEDKWTMNELFHTIPTELLRAIVLGTVAYDDIQHSSSLPSYSDNGPGVYVISISIDGRHGAFLNNVEIRTLINKMTSYVDAYAASKVAKASRNSAERAAIKAARSIDSAYRKSSTDNPHFIKSDAHADQVKTLIEWFNRRASANSPRNDLTYHHQAPQYVGCSQLLKGRLDDYCLTNQLNSMNRLLGLTLSVISDMGLTPRITKKVAVKTWLPKQLRVAEVLLITLAQSPFGQGGFNIQDGGNTPGKYARGVLATAFQEVVFKPYLRANLEKSLRDMRERQEFVENRNEMEALLINIKMIDTDLDALVNDIEQQAHDLEEFGFKPVELQTRQLAAKQAEVEKHG